MTQRKKSLLVFGFFGWLLLVFGAAGIGAIASVNAQAFYAQLAKPAWAPPPGVFGPVWSALYLLMAVSVWLAWRLQCRRGVLLLFLAQLAANSLWSWLFFAWHLGALATIDVLALLALIATTLMAFRQTSRLAAALLLPYLLWVGFASALTIAIWHANPGLL